MREVGGLIGPAGGVFREPGAGGTAGAAAAGLPSAEGSPSLMPGGIVQAEILEARGLGEGVVDIGGRLFQALFPEGLSAGERLALRVVSLGPPLVLQIPDRASEALAKLANPPPAGFAAAVRLVLSAAAPEGLGPAQREVFQALQRVLALPAAPADLAVSLSRLLGSSGIFHEALLAVGRDPEDLKSLALRLLGSLPEGATRKALEALVGHVEAHQARSVLEGLPVIPFALPWGEEPIRGEWRVEERSGRRPDGRAASGSIRIRLEMPNLGPTEVSVRWGEAGTAATLRLQPAVLDAALARLEELSKALVREVRMVDLRMEALEEAPPRSGPGLVEVVA